MKKLFLSLLLVFIMMFGLISKTFAIESPSPADFSNAKFSFEYGGVGTVYLKITGVSIADDAIVNHRVAITTDNSEPNVGDSYSFVNIFKSDGSGYKTGNVEEYVELNHEKFYVWIYFVDYSKSGSGKYSLINGKAVEVDRLESKEYSDVFFATYLSSDSTQILLNTPWYNQTKRNMKIKVGEITDASILNKIKNNDINGMKELLSYSKSNNNSVYNQTVKSTIRNNNCINGYEENVNINYNDLKDKSYYYLYVQLDDEIGEYYPVEGVTLAQCSKIDLNSKWHMSFLGSDQFSWDGLGDPQPKEDPGTTAEDTSVTTKNLPYTGTEKIIVFVLAMSVVTCVLFVKNEKYKGL